MAGEKTTNPTKYQLPKPYSFQDKALCNKRKMSQIWQVKKLQTLPSINFLNLTVSKIRHGQDFKYQSHYDKVKDNINAISPHCTPTPLTNAPMKYQLPTPYDL